MSACRSSASDVQLQNTCLHSCYMFVSQRTSLIWCDRTQLLTTTFVRAEMSMDWIHPWIGLDWVRWLLCTKFWRPMFSSETDQDCSM